MSTRAHVLITDEHEAKDKNGVLFYRHSDGYPLGIATTLLEFMGYVGTSIRDNAQQSAGWLIPIGQNEYKKYGSVYPPAPCADGGLNCGKHWKVGAYEPALGVHGDIEWFYIVNVSDRTITGFEFNGETTVAEFFDRTDGKPLHELCNIEKKAKLAERLTFRP